MRTFLMVTAVLMLSGCNSAVNQPIVNDRLKNLADAHAISLAGEDRAMQLRTGRDLIATIDSLP